jgi:dTDP-glucose pyrophosphorylase
MMERAQPPNATWEKALLNLGASLKDAIRCLDASSLRIVLVTNDQGRLEGTVSDGDIRRGLLKGVGLDSSITEVLRKDALVVPPSISAELVMQLMRSNRLQQIPVVDEQQRVIGLHLWDEVAAPIIRENIMVIMAGGVGKRLRPHTDNCPKPLLPVAGRPMLEHIIERAKLEGFAHFVISIHYLGHMIEEYFGDGARLNVQINYLREETPLGTAGALRLLSPIPRAPFVVTNGDVLTDIRYGEILDFHVRHSSVATMAVREHEWQHPFGVVYTHGIEIAGFEEKPVARTHINAGVYVLNPDAVQIIGTNGHYDMPTLFDELRAQGCRTVAYPMHEPWLDVGRPDDYLELSGQMGQT